MTITNKQLRQIKNSTLLRELERRVLVGEIRRNYGVLHECGNCCFQQNTILISNDFDNDEYYLDFEKVEAAREEILCQEFSLTFENKNHEPK